MPIVPSPVHSVETPRHFEASLGAVGRAVALGIKSPGGTTLVADLDAATAEQVKEFMLGLGALGLFDGVAGRSEKGHTASLLTLSHSQVAIETGRDGVRRLAPTYPPIPTILVTPLGQLQVGTVPPGIPLKDLCKAEVRLVIPFGTERESRRLFIQLLPKDETPP